MRYPILSVQHVDAATFVKHWAAKYPLVNEADYQNNIGKPLTANRLLALFKWKNNGPIARRKLESIKRNYINQRPQPPSAENGNELVNFICQPGGAIWRIFWLHCHSPLHYPIFDQHVYRAMHHLKSGIIQELPPAVKAKAIAYANEYLSFYTTFQHLDSKLVDQALWSYGKYMKAYPPNSPNPPNP